MSDTDSNHGAGGGGGKSNLPGSRAVNVSTEPNTVRAVVGGPLCDTGLPFGHSVIAGDRSGAITLRSAISGLERRRIGTTHHGCSNTNGASQQLLASCSGGLPNCNETVAVTVAEVVVAADDGSPTVWLGCADGSLQVYYLGGQHQQQQQSQQSNRRVSPSFASSRHATPKRTAASAADQSGGEQQQEDHGGNALLASPPACTRCGTPVAGTAARSSTPPASSRLGPRQQQQQSSVGRGASASAASPLLSPGRATLGGGSRSGVTSPSSIGGRKSASNNKASSNSNSLGKDSCLLLLSEKHHSGAIQCIVSAPSLGSVFTGGADWLIVRWRAHHPLGIISPVGRHSRSIRSLAFAPGNPCILLSGGDDGVIKLWSSRQKKPTEMAGHRGGVLSVAPWYDTLGLFGDILTGGVSAAGGGGAASVAAPRGNTSSISGANVTAVQQQQQEQQQDQKAIGVISTGEDGTLRLWAADSTVANTVLRVSAAPLVGCHVFSDNIVCVFAKDGTASFFDVVAFPNTAHPLYRFSNVGQVHRAMTSSPSSRSGGGRLTNYLHDVKILAHLNGLLVWSLTSQGAKVSLLPLQHLEHTTKRFVQTIEAKKGMLEALVCETLDDADSTASGGQLLFQRLADGSIDLAALLGSGGGGATTAQAALLQLAKLQSEQAANTSKQQQQTSNSMAAALGGGGAAAAGGAAAGWHFDPTDLDDTLDPGQLSAVETSASSLRSLTRGVAAVLSEMSRLLDEFHGRKIDLQMQSFQKVMEKTTRAAHESLRKESDALAVRQKEILRAEREMMESDTHSTVTAHNNKDKSGAGAAAAAATKPKINPRKQIAEMLHDMLSGKRTAISTRSSTPFSASASSSPDSNKIPVPSNATATLGDEEKRLLDGIQRSITGEGAASYLYSYIAAMQFLASDKAEHALKLLGDKKGETERAREKQQQEAAARKEKLQAVKDKKEVLEKEEEARKRGELVDASVKKQLDAEVAELKRKLDRATADVSNLRHSCYEWQEKNEELKATVKDLKEKIPKEPSKMKPVTEEERSQRESKTTGTFAPNSGDGGGGGVDGAAAGAATDGQKVNSLASLSLVVTCDKKMTGWRKKLLEAAADEGAAAAAGAGGADDKTKKKKKRGPDDKSDEEEVATKKDTNTDQVVVTLPGVGSWGGAERKTVSTQTRLRTRTASAVQVNTVDASCLPEETLNELMRLRRQAVDKGHGRYQLQQSAAAATTMSTGVGSGDGDDGISIIPVTLPAGWNEEDFELIRQSEEFLGLASNAHQFSLSAAVRHSNNNHSSSSPATPGTAAANSSSSAYAAGDGENSDNQSDPQLKEVGEAIEAATKQLRQLETLYRGSQSSIVAFSEAAHASGLPLDDPRIRGELERLKGEERMLMEEMRRLHHLLVAPASSPVDRQVGGGGGPWESPLRPGLEQHLSAVRRRNNNNNISNFAAVDESSSGTNTNSLLQEFHDLIGREKVRVNSPPRAAHQHQHQQQQQQQHSPPKKIRFV